jgi:tight adherence protein C
MLLLIIIFAVGAVCLGAWSASTSLELRTGARRSMRAMDDYQTVNVRDQEMLETFSDRVVAPIGKKALELANKFTPVGYVENLKKKVVHAGNPPGFETDRFLILKVLGVVSCALWVILGFWLFSDNTLLLLLFIGFMCALAVMGPDLVLDRRIKERRNEIERRLPDTLDLLVISVEAGLGFEQALDRTAEAVPGPLSDELRRMLQETRMGASRADALRALDERTDVEDLRTFIVAMLQADTFGVSVARILHTQADEIRERRRQYAQEQSQKLPVKMLFPLVTCVFPATLVVVVLPGLLQVYDQLK